jgi:hypothetical protein
MLEEQLVQTVCGLEILRRLDWKVEYQPAEGVGLEFVFKTFLCYFWLKVNIDAEKDKPFTLSLHYPYPSLETGAVKEAAAWLLSDICSLYLLVALREALMPIYGYPPLPIPSPYDSNMGFQLVANELAIMAAYTFRKPETGIVVVQVPKSLNPDGFYAAVTFNKGNETVLELNDTYPAIVRSLECAIALNLL